MRETALGTSTESHLSGSVCLSRVRTCYGITVPLSILASASSSPFLAARNAVDF